MSNEDEDIKEFRVTPTTVLKILINEVEKIYPFLNSIVFSPSLDYANIINLHRNPINKDKNLEIVSNNAFPLLAWNRSNLQRSMTKRVLPTSTCVIDGKAYKAKFFLGEVDATLNFYSASVKDIERIETDILFETGLASIKTITMNVRDSAINYGIYWDYDLNSIDFELETNFYKCLSTSVKIQGAILYLDQLTTEDLSNVIFGINFGIYDCSGNLIESSTIDDVKDILEAQGENVKAEYNKWRINKNGNK